jgi:hypothetical protein
MRDAALGLCLVLATTAATLTVTQLVQDRSSDGWIDSAPAPEAAPIPEAPLFPPPQEGMVWVPGRWEHLPVPVLRYQRIVPIRPPSSVREVIPLPYPEEDAPAPPTQLIPSPEPEPAV